MQNRRNFIKTTALIAAGSTLLPHTTIKASSHTTSSTKGSGKMTLTFKPYPLKLRHVFTVASFSRTSTPDVQVEINYEGYTGYGEASMPPYLGESEKSVMTFLSKVDLSQFDDPFKLEDILTYIDQIESGNTAAKASVDIALHDLVGKLLHAPWYKIWGLDKNKTPNTTYTIGIDTAKIVKQKTEECNGKFKILKVKLGKDNDKEIIRAIRSVTNVPLAVDVNQGWKDKHYALDMIHWLKEQGIVMVEQPMPKEKLDDMAWLTQNSPLPTFADEAIKRLKDVKRISGAYNGINIKLMKCTGMREGWRMVNLAHALGMQAMVGCMTETSCAVSAAAQFSPAVDFADLDGNLLIANDRFKGMEVIDGKITLNDLPGIGLLKL